MGDDQHSRARQAWAALQYSLDDLVDMRPRIGNQMPALDRALKRLDAALSKEYDASGQIELGILGERIIAQAQAADDTMVPSDAAELKTFAAALAVFLERFPEWKAYRSDDTRPEAAPLPRDLLPAIDAVFEDLIGRPEVDAVIPQKLREQSEDVREEPENRKLIRGFVDSVNNVLGILAEAALKGARVVISEIKDFSGQTWKKVKKIGSTAAALYVAGKVTGLGSAAADFFAKTAVGLRSIAQTNPEEFGWLLKFLTLLGL